MSPVMGLGPLSTLRFGQCHSAGLEHQCSWIWTRAPAVARTQRCRAPGWRFGSEEAYVTLHAALD